MLPAFTTNVPFAFVHRTLENHCPDFHDFSHLNKLAISELSLLLYLFDYEIFREPSTSECELIHFILDTINASKRGSVQKLSIFSEYLYRNSLSNFGLRICPLSDFNDDKNVKFPKISIPSFIATCAQTIALLSQCYGWQDTFHPAKLSQTLQLPTKPPYPLTPATSTFMHTWLAKDEGFQKLDLNSALTSNAFAVPKITARPPWRGVIDSVLNLAKLKCTFGDTFMRFFLPTAVDLCRTIHFIRGNTGTERFVMSKHDIKNAFRRLFGDAANYVYHNVQISGANSSFSISAEMGDGESVARMAILSYAIGYEYGLGIIEFLLNAGKLSIESLTNKNVLCRLISNHQYYDDFHSTIAFSSSISDKVAQFISSDLFIQTANLYGMIIEKSKSMITNFPEKTEFLGCIINDSHVGVSQKRLDKTLKNIALLWNEEFKIRTIAQKTFGCFVSFTSNSVYKSSALLNRWRLLLSQEKPPQLSVTDKIKLVMDAFKILMLFKCQKIERLIPENYTTQKVWLCTDACKYGLGGFWSTGLDDQVTASFQAGFFGVGLSWSINVKELLAACIMIILRKNARLSDLRQENSSDTDSFYERWEIYIDNFSSVCSLNRQSSKSPMMALFSRCLFNILRPFNIVPYAIWLPGLLNEKSDYLSRNLCSPDLAVKINLVGFDSVFSAFAEICYDFYQETNTLLEFTGCDLGATASAGNRLLRENDHDGFEANLPEIDISRSEPAGFSEAILGRRSPFQSNNHFEAEANSQADARFPYIESQADQQAIVGFLRRRFFEFVTFTEKGKKGREKRPSKAGETVSAQLRTRTCFASFGPETEPHRRRQGVPNKDPDHSFFQFCTEILINKGLLPIQPAENSPHMASTSSSDQNWHSKHPYDIPEQTFQAIFRLATEGRIHEPNFQNSHNPIIQLRDAHRLDMEKNLPERTDDSLNQNRQRLLRSFCRESELRSDYEVGDMESYGFGNEVRFSGCTKPFSIDEYYSH